VGVPTQDASAQSVDKCNMAGENCRACRRLVRDFRAICRACLNGFVAVGSCVRGYSWEIAAGQ
jgi:hypothetical protein